MQRHRLATFALVAIASLASASCGTRDDSSSGRVTERRGPAPRSAAFTVRYLLTDTRRAGEGESRVHKSVSAADAETHDANVRACHEWARASLGSRACREVRGQGRPVTPALTAG